MTLGDVEIGAIVAALREHGTDTPDVEAKSASRGLPKSVRETLSAFSNDHGGVLVLGLAEADGFAPSRMDDPAKIRDDLAAMCSDSMAPPVRAEIEIVTFEGAPLVVASVPELPLSQKPCSVKDEGLFTGSYTRTGDGDRHLTQYEVGVHLANRGQPREDVDPVVDATVDDLDPAAVARLLERVRERQPHAFVDEPDDVVLRRLRVLVRHDEKLVPSLGGLLALGIYPQEFFPRLNLTFISVPATSKDRVPVDGPRFLDNQTINGSIPVMVREALRIITRNMATRADITAEGRADVFDYPQEALREAVVNALLHRDYSAGARGQQVQVEMFQDRIQVRNAGGLFGAVTEDDLGDEGVSSSRNSYLSVILAETVVPGTGRVVAENRGSGVPTMLSTLRRAGMTTPLFASRVASFSVTFPKHTLLGAETHAWLSTLGPGLSEAQCMALALMREGRIVTNASLRQLGLDSRDATAALVGLVERGLARSSNGRRYAQYSLAATARRGEFPAFADRDAVGPPSSTSVPATGQRRASRAERGAQILALFGPGDVLSAAEIALRISLTERRAADLLTDLVDSGRLEATAPPRSPLRRYRSSSS